MKRASHTLRKGDETPANIIITFPINLLGSKSKGRIFHRCGSNLYSTNFIEFQKQSQGALK